MENAPFGITKTATRELHRLIMKHKIIPPEGVRIDKENGSLILGFDAPKPDDEKFYINRITFYVNKELLPELNNVIINFYNGLEKKGFYFETKNR